MGSLRLASHKYLCNRVPTIYEAYESECRILSDHDPSMLKSVEKAFRVLAVFRSEQRSLGLSEISEITQIDKSGTQRLVHTLSKLGYLDKDSKTKLYQISPKFLEFSADYIKSNLILKAAAPHLLNLSKITEEAVNLTVHDNTHIIYAQRLISRHVLANDVVIGTRLPVYCTAPGHAILSTMCEKEAKEIIEHSELIAFTKSTVLDVDEILQRIQTTKKVGYSVMIDQIYMNDVSVAAPIATIPSRRKMALSISVNKIRMSPEDVESHFAPLLTSTAQILSSSSLLSQ